MSFTTDDTIGELIEAGARVLMFRGSWEPGDDDADVPEAMAAELADIAQQPCEVCAENGLCRTGYDVADHWHIRRREEYEWSLPVWVCACGHEFKIIDAATRRFFFEIGEDGLLGDDTGYIEYQSKNQVKHSDVCTGCSRMFASTIADRVNPQQALF